MARLVGRDVAYVQENRISCAKEFAENHGVVLVLKGANTVIASPDGEIFINNTGGPGMAKGGSGDILTGMIVSFLAQGMAPLDAAKAGVYVHGLAGDIASSRLGEYV
jgi:NAD(P)H-hydrate epimerase